ncbi:SIR2 family protein [Arthrobacter sp. H5]|uniref:SIR2 family protein n=1 Tax=Arthrobacter sp. H5 TaxID=1267973 RepID=UPI0004BB2FF2|nr:SIR2 family protein [Arthrobacter sp. H5]
MYGITKAQQIIPALTQFIQTAAAAAQDRRERAAESDPAKAPSNRPVPLLAIPLFGTGGGGAGLIRGEVISTLLQVSLDVATREGVDVVLVLRDPKDFALAQQLRKRDPGSWRRVLSPVLREHAKALAERARANQLVPFMGAGVSVSAGAPTWSELIARLAARVGLNRYELANLKKRNVLDQASILRTIFDQSGLSLNAAIVNEVALDRYGLAPALLASLPCKQAITLNYDDLFERASHDAGMPAAVIPNDPSAQRSRWLLKLHGSVTHPETIVLTREDYLGFNTTRSALSALVKANLITHHLLFVGFGLADDHFHEIVHDVRRAFPELSADNHDVATALTLSRDPLDEYAWKDKLTLLPMSDGAEVPDAARTLEIFLDMLLAHAVDSHSYLLAPGYREVLTTEEDAVRTKVLELGSSLSPAERASSGGTRVLDMLRELGADLDEVQGASAGKQGRPRE